MITAGELVKSLQRVILMDKETKLLTADEFAEMYGYSPAGMRTILKRGKIDKAFKVGKEWFIAEDACINVRQNKKKRSGKLIGVDGFLC